VTTKRFSRVAAQGSEEMPPSFFSQGRVYYRKPVLVVGAAAGIFSTEMDLQSTQLEGALLRSAAVARHGIAAARRELSVPSRGAVAVPLVSAEARSLSATHLEAERRENLTQATAARMASAFSEAADIARHVAIDRAAAVIELAENIERTRGVGSTRAPPSGRVARVTATGTFTGEFGSPSFTPASAPVSPLPATVDEAAGLVAIERRRAGLLAGVAGVSRPEPSSSPPPRAVAEAQVEDFIVARTVSGTARLSAAAGRSTARAFVSLMMVQLTVLSSVWRLIAAVLSMPTPPIPRPPCVMQPSSGTRIKPASLGTGRLHRSRPDILQDVSQLRDNKGVAPIPSLMPRKVSANLAAGRQPRQRAVTLARLSPVRGVLPNLLLLVNAILPNLAGPQRPRARCIVRGCRRRHSPGRVRWRGRDGRLWRRTRRTSVSWSSTATSGCSSPRTCFRSSRWRGGAEHGFR